MPRANRHYIPGHIWHLTHRCHDRRFLLRAQQDRRTWTRWVREARKRFGLCVLDYCVTCNHTHLLVHDTGDEKSIAQSVQLVAGRTAQTYNERKNRGGAFWEDRYHATAVDSGQHLRRCLGYIALNMVRAGVVSDPSEWEFCGYADIQNQRVRNQIVDYRALAAFLKVPSLEELRQTTRSIVEESRAASGLLRQPEWTEAIAIGDRSFIENVKERLGARARYRGTGEQPGGVCILREETAPYTTELESTQPDNSYFWQMMPDAPIFV